MVKDRIGALVGLALGFLAFFLAILAIGTLVAAGEEPPENFEWTPSGNVTDLDVDQYPFKLIKDLKTGEVFSIYTKYKAEGDPYKVVDCNAVSLFNSTTLTWEHRLEMEYNHIYSYAAYDRHIYMLLYNYGQPTFSYAIDDPNASRSVTYSLIGVDIVGSVYQIVNIDDSEMKVLAQITYRINSPYGQRIMFDLVTVDLDTSACTSKTLAKDITEFGNYVDVNSANGIVDIIWQAYTGTSSNVYRLRHDLGTGVSTGPELFESLTLESHHYPAQPKWGPDGSIHMFYSDQGPMVRRYSPDGEFLGSFDMTGLINSPTVPSFGVLPIAVNGSGCVYIAYYNRYSTYIRTIIISSDYSGYAYSDVAYGDFEAHTLKGIFDVEDRLIFVYSDAEEDIARLKFTLQVQPTPDLEVDPSTFSFKDDEHNDENIAFAVRNIGRGDASFYNVTVTCSPKDGETILLIGSEEVHTGLLRDGFKSHSFPTKLPGGTHRVRVTISQTGPLEIWTDNNVFEAWIHVKDKAPVLMVYWPHDGQSVDETLHYQGLTSDMEDPDGVITFIDIPDSGHHEMINGSGDWERTVDVSEVPSGRYGLIIRAYDGDQSTIVSMMVLIDHPEETLTVEHYSPGTDVSLIVGDGQVFGFEAADMFMRPIGYKWTLDGTAVSEDVTSYAHIAMTAGEHTLRAEGTNTYHTVSHEWTVTVRDPIAPTLTVVGPETSVSITKGETVDFQVSVDNPDERTYSILWNRNGFALDGDDPFVMTVTFPASGDFLVTATLVAAEGVSKADWTVAVANRAPVIAAAEPETEHIDITQITDMTFRISAEDPDGDDLHYAWSSAGLDLRDLAGPEGIVSLPCDDEEPYTITVMVTDGEDEATWAWTIRPDPPVNHAPVLSAAHPSDDPVVIEKTTSITYTVEASDPDGDDLTYTWGSSLLAMDERNENGYAVDCPCDEPGEYTIWVVVSDGDEIVRAEWTVKAQPMEEAPDMQNGHLPFGLIIAIAVASCAAAVAYIYLNKTKRGQE